MLDPRNWCQTSPSTAASYPQMVSPLTPQAETAPPAIPGGSSPQPYAPSPPFVLVFPDDGGPPVRIKSAGLEGMDFEELRDTVLGLLGTSVEVEPSAVHRPF